MLTSNLMPRPWSPATPYTGTPADVRAAFVVEIRKGLPVAAVCGAPGWPRKPTIRAWRRNEPNFDAAVTGAQAAGRHDIEVQVLAEIVECERTQGRAAARVLLYTRHRQLASSHAAYFAGGAWSLPAEKLLGIKPQI